MISSLGVENVRLFEGEGWDFHLGKLTLLCGTNSSGKSTLLKLPLLLKQTQESHGPDEACSLRFVGELVDMGTYQTLVSREDVSRRICLQVGTRIRLKADEGLVLTNRRKAIEGEVVAKFRFAATRPSRNLHTQMSLEGEITDPASLTGSVGTVLEGVEFEVREDGRSVLAWKLVRSEPAVEAMAYTIELPADYYDKEGGRDLVAPEKVHDGSVVFRVHMRGLMPGYIWGEFSGRWARDEGQEVVRGYMPLPPIIDRCVGALSRSIQSMQYLGPLRAPAQRFYFAQAVDTGGSDPTGQLLPFVLKERANQTVRNARIGAGKPKSETLELALGYWVHYIKTGESGGKHASDEVSLRSTRDVLVELMLSGVEDDPRRHSLADSGFGYSQVIPILVKTLLAESNSLVLIEQPELHLNPGLQVRLADFFVAMTRAGKQFLIETHSEHLVNAVRVHVAEDKAGQLERACRVYFFEPADRLRSWEMNILADGALDAWPSGFMGEAARLSSRLLRAQAARLSPEDTVDTRARPRQ